MKNCEMVEGLDGRRVLCLAPSSLAPTVCEADIDVEKGRRGNRVWYAGKGK